MYQYVLEKKKKTERDKKREERKKKDNFSRTPLQHVANKCYKVVFGDQGQSLCGLWPAIKVPVATV